MPLIFEVEDYDGVSVQLDEDRWRGHIVDQHSDVESCIDGLKATLQLPNMVYRHASELLYYRLGACRNYPNLYLKIVVRDSKAPHNEPRRVVTAHLTPLPPAKGELLWMQH